MKALNVDALSNVCLCLLNVHPLKSACSVVGRVRVSIMLMVELRQVCEGVKEGWRLREAQKSKEL